MTVLPAVRLPVIGTSLAMIPVAACRAVGAALRRMRFANLEFHAIDLIDGSDLCGSPLLGVQPDLSAAWTGKRARFEAAIRGCAGRRNDTLEGYASA